MGAGAEAAGGGAGVLGGRAVAGVGGLFGGCPPTSAGAGVGAGVGVGAEEEEEEEAVLAARAKAANDAGVPAEAAVAVGGGVAAIAAATGPFAAATAAGPCAAAIAGTPATPALGRAVPADPNPDPDPDPFMPPFARAPAVAAWPAGPPTPLPP